MNVCLRQAAAVTLVALLAAQAGCSEPPSDYHETLRIDEKIGETQLQTLERIAAEMPDERLPSMDPHFLPAPRWKADRPAGVSTLAREELERLRELRRMSTLAKSLDREARLKHVLRREGLTMDQYVSLVLAVGLASQKTRLDPVRDLPRYVEVGRAELKQLKTRMESFALLTPKGRADALEAATWVTRVDRAERLMGVPGENAAFAEANRGRLEKILPKAFLREPLAAVSVPLIDRGVPFREQADTGNDGDLSWNPSDERALIGGQRKNVASEPTGSIR